mgnify:CR=1 FL=1
MTNRNRRSEAMRNQIKVSPRLAKSLQAFGPKLAEANKARLAFKEAAKYAGVSIPTAMLYCRLLNLSWGNYKPRGKYKPKVKS